MDDSSSTTAARLSPIAGAERIGELDMLRGFALCGVLVANVWLFFSGAFLRFPELREELRHFSLDTFTFLAISVLISGKAMTTFGLLFGAGFAVQLERSEGKNVAFGRFFGRRLTVLLLLGLIHALLLWPGDILNIYALCGFGLLLFRRRSDVTLLVCGLLLFLVVPLLLSALPLVLSTFGVGPRGPQGTHGFTTSLLSRLQEGDYLERLRVHHEILIMRAQVWVFALAQSLGAFLVGAWAVRRRLVERARSRPEVLRRITVVGLVVGLGLAAGLSAVQYRAPELLVGRWMGTVTFGLRTVSTAFATLGYVSLALLLYQRVRWRRLLELFSPAGRMALTNYLAQTAICLIVFYETGLIGRIGSAASLGISVVIFAFQLAFSRWWLARFRFGPMEWVWRSLTYGRRQPMRREQASATPSA